MIKTLSLKLSDLFENHSQRYKTSTFVLDFVHNGISYTHISRRNILKTDCVLCALYHVLLHFCPVSKKLTICTNLIMKGTYV